MTHESTNGAPGSSHARILVVDDDRDIGAQLDLCLFYGSWEIVTCPSASEAVPLIADGYWDAIVIDDQLPDGDGLALLELATQHLEAMDSATFRVAHLRDTSQHTRQRALAAGSHAIILRASSGALSRTDELPLLLERNLRRLAVRAGKARFGPLRVCRDSGAALHDRMGTLPLTQLQRSILRLFAAARQPLLTTAQLRAAIWDRRRSKVADDTIYRAMRRLDRSLPGCAIQFTGGDTFEIVPHGS